MRPSAPGKTLVAAVLLLAQLPLLFSFFCYGLTTYLSGPTLRLSSPFRADVSACEELVAGPPVGVVVLVRVVNVVVLVVVVVAVVVVVVVVALVLAGLVDSWFAWGPLFRKNVSRDGFASRPAPFSFPFFLRTNYVLTWANAALVVAVPRGRFGV